MGNPFIAMIDDMVSKLEEPENLSITRDAQSNFSKAIDKANEYRGHPFVLWEALKLFGQVDSRPLFYAGIAYIYLNAAYKEELSYDREGLTISQRWLDKALELAPDVSELLVVQLYIHIRCGDYGPAIETGKRLAELGPYSFYAWCAQLEYYVVRNNRQKFTEAYQAAVSLALTTTRKSYILSRAAKYFLILKMWDEGIDTYRELARLTPADPWMWHNMSIIYLRKKNIIQAWRCNNIALKIMDFGNARNVQAYIHNYIIRRAFQFGVVAILMIIFLARCMF